jgi:hypothetical protein
MFAEAFFTNRFLSVNPLPNMKRMQIGANIIVECGEVFV